MTTKKISKILLFCLVLSIFSYPVTSSIFHLFSVPSSRLNFFVKAGFAIVYLVYFCYSLFYKGHRSLSRSCILILLSLYSVRLLVDVFYYDIKSDDYSQNYLLLYFFILTFLPVFAILRSGSLLSIQKFNMISGLMLIIINLCYLLVTFISGQSLEPQLASRLNVQAIDSDHVVISPISISMYGACMISYSLYKLLFSKLKKRDYLLYSMLVFIGFLNLAVGASRGPLVITILLITFMLMIFFKDQKSDFLNYLKNTLGISVLIIFASLVVIPSVREIDFFLVDRMVNFFEVWVVEERNYTLRSAFNDFLDSPIFGSHIFDTKFNAFPHNIGMDALMALGIFGGILVVVPFISFTRNLLGCFSPDADFGYGLFLVTLTPIIFAGLTSGSFLFMPEFWISLSLTTIQYKHFKY